MVPVTQTGFFRKTLIVAASLYLSSMTIFTPVLWNLVKLSIPREPLDHTEEYKASSVCSRSLLLKILDLNAGQKPLKDEWFILAPS